MKSFSDIRFLQKHRSIRVGGLNNFDWSTIFKNKNILEILKDLEEFTQFLAFSFLNGFLKSSNKTIDILGEVVYGLYPLITNMEVHSTTKNTGSTIFLYIDFFTFQKVVKTTYCTVFSNTFVFSYYRSVKLVYGNKFPAFTHGLLVYLIENQDLPKSEIFDIDVIQSVVEKIPFHGVSRIKFFKLVLSLKNSLKLNS